MMKIKHHPAPVSKRLFIDDFLKVEGGSETVNVRRLWAIHKFRRHLRGLGKGKEARTLSRYQPNTIRRSILPRLGFPTGLKEDFPMWVGSG
jgi:hypothetical protein